MAEITLETRVTKVEAQIESTFPHIATKADLERQTRQLIMWYVGVQIAVILLFVQIARWGIL